LVAKIGLAAIVSPNKGVVIDRCSLNIATKMIQSSDRSSMIALISGAVLISFSAVFVKVVSVGPTTSAFYRMAFGSAILVVIELIRRDRLFVSKRALIYTILAGVFFSGDLTFWHRSVIYTGPGISTMLANFQVVFLAIIGLLVLHEHPGWKALVAIPLALGGLLLLVGPKWEELGGQYHWGVIFGLITAMFYACYVLSLRGLRKLDEHPTAMASITVVSVVTTVILLFINLAEGESFAIPDTHSWLALVAYGICGQVLGWVLITRGIQGLTAARIGLILLLQPTLSFAWDIIFFHRPTVLVEVVGALIALGAIYLGGTRSTRAQNLSPEQSG